MGAGRRNPTNSKAFRRASRTTEAPMTLPFAVLFRFESINQLPAHKTFDFDFHVPCFASGLDGGFSAATPWLRDKEEGIIYILAGVPARTGICRPGPSLKISGKS